MSEKAMNSSEKAVKEPLFHIVKRNAVPLKQRILIKAGAIVLSLIVCGLLGTILTGNTVFLFISLTAPDRTSNQALLSVLSIFHEWHLFGHSHDCLSPPAQPDNTTFRADYRAM